jgi:hypothetical protein
LETKRLVRKKVDVKEHRHRFKRDAKMQNF